jgi:phosphoserine phosphatase RsbU/P
VSGDRGLYSGDGVHEDDFYAALLDDDAAELYENAPCGYLSLLPDGTIIKANRTFLTWTGLHRQDIVGRRRLADLLSPGDRIFYETHFSPLLRMQGRVREIAVEIVTRNGERLPVLANAVLKSTDSGDPIVIRVAVFDATERRAYEGELLAARRRAEESEATATALARTLQAALLPPAIIQPPGLHIGASYRPAGDGSIVGGDFYDIFETGDRSVFLLLGDVAGKGPEAALVASLVRHTVRVEALRQPDPGLVLRTVAAALGRYHPDRYCTAVLFEVNVERSSATIAVGGHHLPVRLRANGSIDMIGAPGQILGLIDEPEIEVVQISIDPGDVVVSFTDGVVEARRQEEFFGDVRAADAVESVRSRNPQAVTDHLAAAAVEFQGGHTRDDIAVLAWAPAPLV